MKPTYEVRAWRELSWWQARVVDANDSADPAPIGEMAHTRALTTVEQTVRDLIATILDVDDRAFDVEIEYLLPRELEIVVFEAISAQTWFEAAQDLWRDASSVAAWALASQGFSYRDMGKLLGLEEHSLAALLDPGADTPHRAA
jgi:hypothetical protein